MIYAVEAGPGGPVKIGRATNVGARIAQLQTGCPDELHLLAMFEGSIDRERRLHLALSPWRIRGEWFEPSWVVYLVLDQVPRGAGFFVREPRPEFDRHMLMEAC